MSSMFQAALDEVNNLREGETFFVRDLFQGYIWNRLSVEERRSLGRKFIDSDLNPFLREGKVEALSKTTSGQQPYRVASKPSGVANDSSGRRRGIWPEIP